jgi:sorting nexin-4
MIELEHNYNHFATSIRGLSALETNVDQPLRQFAEATELYVEALKEMVRYLERKLYVLI